MRSDQVYGLRQYAADCKQSAKAAISENWGLYSRLVRQHHDERGRCALYLNADVAVGADVLEKVEELDLSSTIKKIQTYNPDTEGAFLWVPMATAARYGGPDGGGVVTGCFVLHPAVRAPTAA
jgi:hypothetical protein